MKNYRNRVLSDSIATIGSMLLFLLFAGCMLMMIAVAAGTYSRISAGFEKTFGTSAALRYVSNKIKSSESAEIIEDGEGLVMRNGSIVNIIYFSDGGLYEKSVSADIEPSVGGGDRIFELNGLEISESGEWYKIAARLGNEENFTLVRRR